MSDNTEAEKKARMEWRKLMIPSIGAAVILSSTFVNGYKIYQKNGWPNNAFGISDYFLMTIPLFILATALYDGVNGD